MTTSSLFSTLLLLLRRCLDCRRLLLPHQQAFPFARLQKVDGPNNIGVACAQLIKPLFLRSWQFAGHAQQLGRLLLRWLFKESAPLLANVSHKIGAFLDKIGGFLGALIGVHKQGMGRWPGRSLAFGRGASTWKSGNGGVFVDKPIPRSATSSQRSKWF